MLFLLYVLGYCPFVLWSAVQSTFLHLAEYGQRVYNSEFLQLRLSSVMSSLNTSNPVPLEAMHVHAITLLHHVSQTKHVPSLLHTFFFLSFWYRLIWISAVQIMLFAEVIWLFLVVFWQSLIWPCLHLFALVKSSLDCRLWQWHANLLESVLHLAGCYERVFL